MLQKLRVLCVIAYVLEVKIPTISIKNTVYFMSKAKLLRHNHLFIEVYKATIRKKKHISFAIIAYKINLIICLIRGKRVLKAKLFSL